ncbi:MAG: Gfo/Idh/MocA family oxidoreductase, partial [Patescibacteria group bacterium]
MMAHGERSRTINIGVIGAYGFMGKNHARNLRAIQDSGIDVKLVAVSDVNPMVDELGRTYGIPAYLDYREMLVGAQVDAVVVAVPTVHHCQVVCDALEAGAHVLVEKPIAFAIDEADEMVHLAKQLERTLMVGHIEWFNPAVRQLVAMIEGGELGEILMIETKRLNPFPKGRDDEVGISIDLATHDIFNVLKIFGRLGQPFFGKPMAAGGSSPLTSTKFEDHVTMLLPVDGIMAEVTASWLHPFKVRQTTIVGTKGTVVADLISREVIFYPVGEGYDYRDEKAALYDLNFTEKRIPEVPNRRVEPLRLELQEFIAAISEARVPEATGDEAL